MVNNMQLNHNINEKEISYDENLYYYNEIPYLKDPIFVIALVSFHHKKGPIVEYTYPSEEDILNSSVTLSYLCSEDEKSKKYILQKILQNITIYCMPDGCHNNKTDSQFFIVKTGKFPLFGVSCYEQIQYINKNINNENTRNFIQKSMCILSVLPIFSLMYTKLSLTIRVYFHQEDLNDKKILEDLYLNFYYLNTTSYNNINNSISNSGGKNSQNNISSSSLQLDINELNFSFSLRKLILLFKEKIFMLIKLVILQKRILVYSQRSGNVCGFIFDLLSMFPGTLLFNCKKGKYIKHYIKSLKVYGLPLKLFDNNYRLYALLSFFEFDEIKNCKFNWIIGTTNQLIFEELQKNSNVNLVVDLDNQKFSFSEEFDNTKEECEVYENVKKIMKERDEKYENIGWLEESGQRENIKKYIDKRQNVESSNFKVSIISENYNVPNLNIANDNEINKFKTKKQSMDIDGNKMDICSCIGNKDNNNNEQKNTNNQMNLNTLPDSLDDSLRNIFYSHIKYIITSFSLIIEIIKKPNLYKALSTYKEDKKTKEISIVTDNKYNQIINSINNINNIDNKDNNIENYDNLDDEDTILYSIEMCESKKNVDNVKNIIKKNFEKGILQLLYNIKDSEMFKIWNKERGNALILLDTRTIGGMLKIYTEDGGVYQGNVRNGLMEGKGKLLYPDSREKYEGEFRAGKKNGFGTYEVKDNFIYTGLFENGNFHGGGGIFKDSKNNFYEGDFEYGKFNGVGHYTIAQGGAYIGEFVNGLFEGKGQLIDQDGNVFNGQFYKGKKNGEGILIKKNGEKIEGIFKNDKFVEAKEI